MKKYKDFLNENDNWYDIDDKLYLLKSYYHILNNSNKNYDLQKKYFLLLHNFLIIERMFYNDVVNANKEIYKNLKLEKLNNIKEINDKFIELYNVYHPVKNNLETFDSIESLKNYLKNNPKVYREFL